MSPSIRSRLLAAAPGLTFLVAGCSDGLTLPDQSEPAHIEIVSGTNQAGSLGTMLAEPLVVRVTDSERRPVPERKVAFTLVGSDGEVSPDTALTDADGRATVRWVLGNSVGTQRLDARVIGPAPLTVSFVASASVGVAASVEKLRGDAQTAVAGSMLPDSLVVRTLDASGLPVAGITVTWSVTGGGSVTAPITVTGRDGTSGVRRTLGVNVGTQTTAASVQGATGSPVTFTSTAAVGTAGRLRIEVQPASSAESGAPFSRQPQVQLVDDNGLAVPRADVAVTAAIGSGPAGATLVGSRIAFTNAQGLAVFTDLAISGGGGSYTLNFTSANVVGVTSEPVSVSAGAAAALRLTTPPSSTATTGVDFAQQPVVQIVDASGNAVAQSGVSVTVAVASGAGTLGGTLTVQTDASGAARFTDIVITGASGTRTLIFASSGLASVTSGTIDVHSGPDAGQSSIQAPSTLAAGTNGTVTVTVRDDSGTPIAGVAVTLQTTGTGNTITPASVTTDGSGIATFTFSSTDVEKKTLTASVGSISIGPVTVDVEPGAASPSETTASVPDGRRLHETVITVRTRDAFGNPLTTGGAAITGSVTAGPNADFVVVDVEDRGDGTYRLTYMPILSGDDEITILLDGVQISGSPYTSKVRN